MKIQILSNAIDDISYGYIFYEKQNENKGSYFIESIRLDIETLKKYYGIHEKKWKYYRLLSKKFPFAIYYQFDKTTIYIHSILDCRQNPEKIYKRLI